MHGVVGVDSLDVDRVPDSLTWRLQSNNCACARRSTSSSSNRSSLGSRSKDFNVVIFIVDLQFILLKLILKLLLGLLRLIV